MSFKEGSAGRKIGRFGVLRIFRYGIRECQAQKGTGVISYDENAPLIFSHIPKTAGTSVRSIFEGWFGENLLLHYPKKGMPTRHDPAAGQVVYGHFNSFRGFGINDYYPAVAQFVTVMRDPWERALSIYMFRCRQAPNNPRFRHVASMDLAEYLGGWPYHDPQFGLSQLNYLPQPPDPISAASWIAHLESCCVAVGVTEALSAGVMDFARALDKPFQPEALRVLNKTERRIPIPLDIKSAFQARMALEYEVYSHFAGPYLTTHG